MTIVLMTVRGRWLGLVTAFVVLVLALPSLAQRVAPEVPKVPGGIGTGGAGVGGGAGLAPPMPTLRSSPMAVPAAPQVTPIAPAVPAAPATTPAAPVVKFRCQLDPGAEICRGPGSPDGGDEGECNCARDYCYDDPAGFRVCQKQ